MAPLPHRCAPIPLCGTSYFVVFIKSHAFTRRLAQLAGDSTGEVLDGIQQDLLKNPERSSLVPGLGGIRKARTSNPTRGKGKRSGYRYLYLYLELRGHIHLLFLLDKDEQEDLTDEERKVLRKLAAALKGM